MTQGRREMAGNARDTATRALGRRRPVDPKPLVDLTAHADRLRGVRKDDLRPGDWVAVKTRNSWYSLYCLGDGLYLVTGGWFDQQGIAPTIVTVAGCTWGRRAIWTDVVACPGLFLEFGNGVSTTRIREVHVIRIGEAGAPQPNSSCLAEN